MPEAFLSWAHSFRNFCPIGVAIAIVWLIGNAGYRRYISKSLPSADVMGLGARKRVRRRPF